ncbi:copper resistance protein NlpE [Oxalobacter paraformigenes]|uniref:Copper resistance protein NlpE n=1 Tax=Oxalobacter paraformigenes TaxID=556268 RepID=C3X2W0_9BURK|nr:copper resistance protein NlpE [Oxalobacter paraformigenes]EEO27546.2 hypothetical protein OFAG_00699 [Oxalobacter paraformigenes]
MKRFSLFLMGLFMVGILAACSDSSRDNTPPQGMYAGTIPCADCPGIKTAVTFNQDGSVVETQLYENTDGASLSQVGTWKMDKGIVTVTFPFDTQYFIVKSADSIEMTNKEGKRSETMADQYILKKVKPKVASDFSGRYRLAGDQMLAGSGETLTILGNAQNGVTVSFAADGVEEGCTFNGQGKIVNDQIEIPLQTVNPDLKSTLVIRSTGPDTMNVFTSKADDQNDMALFCSNGKTLAGDYVKAK